VHEMISVGVGLHVLGKLRVERFLFVNYIRFLALK